MTYEPGKIGEAFPNQYVARSVEALRGGEGRVLRTDNSILTGTCKLVPVQDVVPNGGVIVSWRIGGGCAAQKIDASEIQRIDPSVE